MSQPYSIEVKYPQGHANEGQPFSGATVELRSSTLGDYTASELGNTGVYHFSEIAPGKYTLWVNLTNTNETFAVGEGDLAGLGFSNGDALLSNADEILWGRPAPAEHRTTHTAAGSDPLTLSISQITDLQAGLDGKVSKTGNESVNGVKTFVQQVVQSAGHLTQASAPATAVLDEVKTYTDANNYSSVRSDTQDGVAQSIQEVKKTNLFTRMWTRVTDNVIQLFATFRGVDYTLTVPKESGTLTTKEAELAITDLKQTVFVGVCQKQYLTENDVEIDCTGVVPVFRINTVKNGETISASNQLCFFTDGNGISQKWTFDTAISVNFTYTAGIWYFHIDNTGTLIATQTPWTGFGVLAVVYRMYMDPTLSGAARSVVEIVEYHKNTIPAEDHLWKHQNNGTIWLRGLDLVANPLPVGSPNVDGRNTCVSLTSGDTLDENLEANIVNSTSGLKFTQDLGNTSAGSLTSTNAGLFQITYNDGSGTLKKLPATRFPFDWNSGTNVPQFITLTGTRTQVTNKRWIVNYLYSFADPRPGEPIKVRSSGAEYSTLVDARAHTWETLQAGSLTLRDREIRPLYKLIHYVETSAPGLPVECKYAVLIESVDIRKQATTVSSATVGTVLATNVSVSPVGGISATNAQAAIEELDTEKAPIASPSFTGNVGIGTLGTDIHTVNGRTVYMLGPTDYISNEGSAQIYATSQGTFAVNGDIVIQPRTSTAARTIRLAGALTNGGAVTDHMRLLGGASAEIRTLRNFVAEKAFSCLEKITGPASTTATASFNAPHGTAPDTPANGDIWTTTAGMYTRINGVTKSVNLT